MTAPACWADPLCREERRVLAEVLDRACSATWLLKDVFAVGQPARYRVIGTSLEMANLYLDVTERAEVATS
jgi:hypothetical protein